MNKYKAWAEATAIKAVKTCAQTLVALLGANAFNVVHVAWGADLGIAAGAGLVCVLHNITGLPGPAAAPAPAPVADPAPVAPAQPVQ